MRRFIASSVLGLFCVSMMLAQSAGKSKSASKVGAGTSRGNVEQVLKNKEKQLWEAWKNKEPKPFNDMLLADFVEIDAAGVGTGAKYITDQMPSCNVKSFSLGDMKVTWLGKDAALLTYQVTVDETCNGQQQPGNIYNSSTWVNKGGKWMAASHQETVKQG